MQTKIDKVRRHTKRAIDRLEEVLSSSDVEHRDKLYLIKRLLLRAEHNLKEITKK